MDHVGVSFPPGRRALLRLVSGIRADSRPYDSFRRCPSAAYCSSAVLVDEVRLQGIVIAVLHRSVLPMHDIVQWTSEPWIVKN